MNFYCKCGYPIFVEWIWNGFKYVPHYESENGEITHCPQCGDELRPEILDKEPDSETPGDGIYNL